MKLLLSQKNRLYKSIVDANLSPEQFHNDLTNSNCKIEYTQNTEYKFDFFSIGSHFIITHCPGVDKHTDVTNVELWDEVVLQFSVWLEALKREMHEVDLWGNLKDWVNKGVFGITSIGDNEKLSDSEHESLVQKINQLQNSISTLSIPESQIIQINEKLDYVITQVNVLGRFDWQSLFIGTVFNIMTTLSLSNETGKLILTWIKQIFHGMLLM